MPMPRSSESRGHSEAAQARLQSYGPLILLAVVLLLLVGVLVLLVVFVSIPG